MQITDIYLFKNVPLDRSQTKQIDFPNGDVGTQQFYFRTNYFYKLIPECSWVYPNTIRLDITFEDALPVNYLHYINNDGAYIYCFVINKRYINDNVTEFVIEIDYFQTYLFDHELMSSYIERQHIDRAYKTNGNTKRIYSSTLETVDTGNEMIFEKRVEYVSPVDAETSKFKNPAIVISTEPLFADLKDADNKYYNRQDNSQTGQLKETHYSVNGVFTPYYVYFTFSASPDITNKYFRVKTGNFGDVGIGKLTSTVIPKLDTVIAHIPIKRMPFDMTIITGQSYDYDLTSIPVRMIKYKEIGYVLMLENNDVTKKLQDFDLSEFIPEFIRTDKTTPHIRNNETKMFTNQFYKMQMLTNQSNIKELKINSFEHLSNIYKLNYGFLASGDYREFIKIDNYNRHDNLYIDASDQSLPLSNNAYQIYMRDNKASRVAGMTTSIVSTVAGIGATAMGGGIIGVPMIVGGFTSIGGMVASDNAKIADLQARPDNIHSQGGNVLFDKKLGKFNLAVESVKLTEDNDLKVYDYLRIYGYKSGRYMKPNLQSRYHFNYIKTIGANIKPIEDMKIDANAIGQLEDIYNRGVIIHHLRDNENYILDIYTEYENIEMGLLNE